MSFKKYIVLTGIASMSFGASSKVETGVVSAVSLPGNGNINLHLGGIIAQNISTPVATLRLGTSAVLAQPLNQNFDQQELTAQSYVALPIKVGVNGQVYAGPGLHYTKKFGNRGLLSGAASEVTPKAFFGYSDKSFVVELAVDQNQVHFLSGAHVKF